jgi:hypothetical protein
MAWSNEPLNTIVEPNWNYFDQLYNKGIDYASQAQADIAAIKNIAIEPPVDIPDPTLIDPSSAVGSITMPTSPTKPTLITATAPDAIAPPTMMLSSVTTVSLNNTIITYLKGQLEARLTNATGLTSAVETALFNRGRDRITAEAQAAYLKYQAQMAANGFSRPTGAELIAAQEFTKEQLGKISEVNRDIIIKQAELEQANIHKVLDQFQALEGLLITQMGVADQNETRLFETKSDVLINQIKIINEVNKLAIDSFLGEVQMYEAQGKLTLQNVEMLLKQYGAINDYNKARTDIAIEKARTLNTYYLGRFQNLVEANKAIGSTMGQLSATLFNTMNYSVSWKWGWDWSGNESKSV